MVESTANFSKTLRYPSPCISWQSPAYQWRQNYLYNNYCFFVYLLVACILANIDCNFLTLYLHNQLVNNSAIFYEILKHVFRYVIMIH